MAQMQSDQFFSALPVFTAFERVADAENYRPLPIDWWIASADIVDSTGAIETGRYKAVNMAGASVISAVLNAVGHFDLPFVFGGDGALVALPPSALVAATSALAAVQLYAREELDLDLRAALVPVSDIRKAGLDVRVARFQVSPDVSYAMFAGGGGAWAETEMKAGRYLVAPAPAGARPDLTGLSCRWNPIASRHGAIVSIIAVPCPGKEAGPFSALVSDIVSLASGEEREGHPVPAEGPTLGLSREGLETEVRTVGKPGRLRQRGRILIEAALTYGLAKLGMTLGRFDPKIYRQDVASNSDFRKFDDGLKMTIDIEAGRLVSLEARLERAASEGVCRYGLHRQDEALMTCIVPTALSRDHMHFIDGANGGYAMAASHLKAPMQAAPAA
ncbi:DUF3095 domain-containing protein [Rhizobium sp. PP-CC-3G-465]|uniref:DUF3095 domain-containing protein n=1 Tax=Rhizobium sp. PP-CC-3G-465 TaxID=2135648 RepID=UPI00104EF174|nr:hypothetical protein C8J33_10187 [Rhizobium sp. PP-CC-3G-465]